MAFLPILLTGCKRLEKLLPKDDTIAVSIIGDHTDNLLKNPDAKEILKIYHLADDEKLYSGVSMRYRTISDVALTPVQTLAVPAISPILAENTERVREMKTFKDNLRQIFESSQKNNIKPMSRSCIYKAVVSEANALAKSAASEKYLIIYSDLLDNDGTLNFYNPIIRDAVQRNPKSIIQSLSKVMKLESLKGVKCLIIFQSSSERQENDFQISSAFYRELLTSAGAECEIVPSLETTNIYAQE